MIRTYLIITLLIRILTAGIDKGPIAKSVFLLDSCSMCIIQLHEDFSFFPTPMIVTSVLILIPIFMAIFYASPLKVLISEIWNADFLLSDLNLQSFQF